MKDSDVTCPFCAKATPINEVIWLEKFPEHGCVDCRCGETFYLRRQVGTVNILVFKYLGA
jgi:hypothetical protein